MKNDPTKLVFNAEQGGGAAVADAPAASQAPDSGDMDTSALIAQTFKTEPRATTRSTQKSAEKKAEPKAVEAAKPAAEVTPETAAPKKESIFDRMESEKKPEPAKVAEVPAAEFDDGVPENDWKAAKQKRAEFKRMAEQAEAKVKQYEADLAAYRQKLPDPAEADRLKAEHKAAMDRLAILDYQSHPDFKKQFVEPKKAISDQASVILSEAGIEGVNLVELINKPRAEFSKAMTEIESKLNSFDAGELRLAVRDLRKINDAEKAAIAQHSNLSEGLRKQSEQKQRVAFEDSFKENSLWIAKHYEIPAGLEPEKVEQLRSFNQAIDQIRPTAERYAFEASDEKGAAALAVKAAQMDFFTKHAAPRMYADYKEAKELVASLTARIKELEGSRPGASFDGGSSGGKPKGDEDLTVEQMVKKTFRS